MSSFDTIEELNTEDWAFRLHGAEVGIKLVDAFEEVPKFPVQLLAIANSTDRFLAAGPDEIVFGQLSDLRSAAGSKATQVPNTTKVDHRGVLLVEVLANHTQFAVYDDADLLTVYSANSTKQWSVSIPGVRSLAAWPGDNALAYSTESGTFLIQNLETISLGQAEIFAVHSSGKKIVLVESAEVKLYNVSDNFKLESSASYSLPSENQPRKIQFIQDRLFYVDQDPHDVETYTAYFLNDGTWVEIPDACPPFADETRVLAWYSADLSNWIASDFDLIVAAAAPSSDVLLSTHNNVLMPAEDRDRAALPFVDNDTTPIGSAVDYSSREDVKNPFPGTERGPAMPIFWVLNNEGHAIAWDIAAKDALNSSVFFPHVARVSGEFDEPRDLAKKGDTSVSGTPAYNPSGEPSSSFEEIDADIGDLSVGGDTSTMSNKSGSFTIKPEAKSNAKFQFLPVSPQLSSQSSAFSKGPSAFGNSGFSNSAFGSNNMKVSSEKPLEESERVDKGSAFGQTSTFMSTESAFGKAPALSLDQTNANVSAGSGFANFAGKSPFAAGTTSASPFAKFSEKKSIFDTPDESASDSAIEAKQTPFGSTNPTSVFGQLKPSSVNTKSSLDTKVNKSPFGSATTSSAFGLSASGENKTSAKTGQAKDSTERSPPKEQKSPVRNININHSGIPSVSETSSQFENMSSKLNFDHEAAKTISGARSDKKDTSRATPRAPLLESTTLNEKDNDGKSEEEESIGDEEDEAGSNLDEEKDLEGADKANEQDKEIVEGNEVTLENNPSDQHAEFTEDLEDIDPALGDESIIENNSFDEDAEFSDLEDFDSGADDDGIHEATLDEDADLPEELEDLEDVGDESILKTTGSDDQAEFTDNLEDIEPDMDEQPDYQKMVEELEDWKQKAQQAADRESQAQKLVDDAQARVHTLEIEAQKRAEEDAKAQAAEEERLRQEKAEAEAKKAHDAKVTSIQWQDDVSSRSILPFEPLRIDGVEDLDEIFAETNSLFQIVDHNISSFKQLVHESRESRELSDSLDLASPKTWRLQNAGEVLSLLHRQVTEPLNVSKLSSSVVNSALKLNSDLTCLQRSINDIFVDFESWKSEVSNDAFKFRQLPIRASKLQRELRQKHTEVLDLLQRAEEATMLEKLRTGNVPSASAISVSIDVLDHHLQRLASSVNTISQSRPVTADLTVALSTMRFNDDAVNEEAFTRRRAERRRVMDIGHALAQRTGSDVLA